MSHGGLLPQSFRRRLVSRRSLYLSCFLALLPYAGISGCSSSTPSDVENATPKPFDVISPYEVTPELSNLQGADFGRAPLEVKVRHFVAKHGADSVVGVLVQPFSNEYHRTIVSRMRDGMGSFEEFSQWQGDRAVLYVAPVTDVESFAAKLDLGELDVDAKQRVIRIRADQDKLAEHAESSGRPRMPRGRLGGGRSGGLSTPREGPLQERLGSLSRPPPDRSAHSAPNWREELGIEAIPENAALLIVQQAEEGDVERITERIREQNPQLEIDHRPLSDTPATFLLTNVGDLRRLGSQLRIGSNISTNTGDRTVSVVMNPNMFRVHDPQAAIAAKLEERNRPEVILADIRTGSTAARSFAYMRVQTADLGDLREEIVEAIKERVTESSGTEPRRALATLIALAGEEERDFFGDLAIFGSPELQLQAALHLGSLGDSRGIETLVALLDHDSDPRVGQLLREFPEDSEPLLLARLQESDRAGLHAEVLRILEDVGGVESYEYLTRYSASESFLESVAERTMEAINQRERIVASDPTGPPSIDDALRRIRRGAREYMVGALDDLTRLDPDPDRAVEVLREVFPLLDEPHLSRRAIPVVRHWYIPLAMNKMIELTRHPGMSVRDMAIRILGKSRDPRGAAAVVKRLPHDSFAVHDALVDLGDIGLEALLDVMEDENYDDRIRVQCLNQFARVGTSKYLPRLKPFEDYSANDGVVALQARSARIRIQSREQLNPGR